MRHFNRKLTFHMTDLRLKSIFSESKIECSIDDDVVVLGFASDEGCVANGGRAGAAAGPAEVFKLLPKVGPVRNMELGTDITKLKVCCLESPFTTHEQLQNVVSKICELKKKRRIPIIVGGSNDQSFPNALGLLTVFPDLDVINIDAHLDVRPGTGHSGSPFQELLNHATYKGQFYEFATQGNQASAEHAEWALAKGTKITWLNEVRDTSFAEILNEKQSPLFVSFDIDAIRASDCPGVSCPGNRGLTAEQALDICLQAGACNRVVGLDISEFNPLIENNITPRLVCQMIYYFVMGFSRRENET
jgi:arginase family enzyme